MTGAAPAGGAVIAVRNLGKTFTRDGRRVEAMRGFNLAIAEGEFVTVVGPSGCGKSTFLHMVGGFEPVTEGELLVDGRPVRGPGPDRGVVFQEFALFPWRTVAENVTWALEIAGRPKPERDAVAERLIAKVGLTHFRQHYPAELSGGMKQRVAIARTLAFDPRILLMDEPFGALDAQNRELMQEELQVIWNDARKTVLFITHDIDEAIYLGDRVVMMTARPGRIKADITVPLPRPRVPHMLTDPAFTALKRRLLDTIEEESLKTFRAENG